MDLDRFDAMAGEQAAKLRRAALEQAFAAARSDLEVSKA
jgi:hypothetical protein